MNEIDVAAGSVIASQLAVHLAIKRNQDEQQFTLEGTRARTCANANSRLLKEASEACELAVRKLLKASDRYNRMNDL